MEKKVDVVICTKDRYELLPKAVNQAKSLLPCNQVIVVDSALSPNRKLLEGLGVHTVFSPDALLGFARQQGLKAAVTDLVVFLDDDIVLEKDWFRIMKQALDRDPDAVAVSSKIVFGYGTDKVLEKMGRRAIRSEGGSIGISILKRKEILGLGGFDPHIHRAEDTELHLRIKKHDVKYKSLFMLNLPSKNERNFDVIINHKADVIRSIQPFWFWESNIMEAEAIKRKVRLPVLCIGNMTLLS